MASQQAGLAARHTPTNLLIKFRLQHSLQIDKDWEQKIFKKLELTCKDTWQDQEKEYYTGLHDPGTLRCHPRVSLR